jgi:hypothetical protein
MSNGVSDRLRLAREKSKKRKELLGYTLGASWAEELGSSGSKQAKKVEDQAPDGKESSKVLTSNRLGRHSKTSSEGEPPQVSQTEEFRDSTAFLKGTQSLNPHNDYSQNFVDTGHRPQNFIRK